MPFQIISSLEYKTRKLIWIIYVYFLPQNLQMRLIWCHQILYTKWGILSTHSLKIARLVAHHWKKLKFSMGILTILAISNEFWKGIGSVWSSVSQSSHHIIQSAAQAFLPNSRCQSLNDKNKSFYFEPILLPMFKGRNFVNKMCF